MRLIGPDGSDVSSVRIVGPGTLGPSVDPSEDQEVCLWLFEFTNVPEVATYRLVSPAGYVFPAASQSEISVNWTWLWYWSL